jgi:hypothetical protein
MCIPLGEKGGGGSLTNGHVVSCSDDRTAEGDDDGKTRQVVHRVRGAPWDKTACHSAPLFIASNP